MTRTDLSAVERLARAGIDWNTAYRLRKQSLRLHRWYERECGDGNGCIERDEKTDKPYWLNSNTMRRYRIPDHEKGTNRIIAAIMAPYCLEWRAYRQTDPRGCALYLYRVADLGERDIESCYSSIGIAVY